MDEKDEDEGGELAACTRGHFSCKRGCTRDDYGQAGPFSIERLKMDLPFANVLCAQTSAQRSAGPLVPLPTHWWTRPSRGPQVHSGPEWNKYPMDLRVPTHSPCSKHRLSSSMMALITHQSRVEQVPDGLEGPLRRRRGSDARLGVGRVTPEHPANDTTAKTGPGHNPR